MTKKKYQARKKVQPKNKKTVDKKTLVKRFKALSIVASLTAVIGLSAYYGGQAVDTIMERPIAKITVKSEFKFISEHDSSEMINKNIKGNFLNENLLRMQEKLLQNPWIDDVILSRRWPDNLMVTIVEQVPVARWNNDSYINKRGEVIKVGNTDNLDYLPKLSASKDAVDMMQRYYRLNQIVSQSNLVIVELEKDARGHWSAELLNGWTLLLGRDQLDEKLKRLNVVVKKQLAPVADNIALIDLRYEYGLAVSWQKPLQAILPVANVRAVNNTQIATEG